MRRIVPILFAWLLAIGVNGQLKYLADDFEGYGNSSGELSEHGIFTYGSLKASIVGDKSTGGIYSGSRCIRIEKNGKQTYAGWGKGLSASIELDAGTDFLNFYLLQPSANRAGQFQIAIQDDDNGDGVFKKEHDDSWMYVVKSEPADKWQLVSIPLNQFRDETPGGDGKLNITYREGKFCGILISMPEIKSLPDKQVWYFDFICVSKGKLPTGHDLFSPPAALATDFCALGAWSKEGNSANFAEIATSFEQNFSFKKELGVVHFFQPFGKNTGGQFEGLYPSAERINKVIDAGYIPMITLEDHFVSAGPKGYQPNLYSIVEGHFDSFFGYWAHQIKDVKGTVLLRILHEFNGDWYPWCTINNDKNPQLVAKAFRYIVNIFRQNNVGNVKFIWCPNSMSLPQEPWNFIMDAYPGDDYVDLVGLDIYNGAGKAPLWRSFRKEGIENYFVLTTRVPKKPLLVCEVASRERRIGESGQDKAQWIKELKDAVKTDMSRIRLLSWFNEKETFLVQSSQSSKKAFEEHILKDPFFRSGKNEIKEVVEK